MGANKRRLINERNYGHLYEFNSLGDRMRCAYCGDVRETIDHIPPLNVVDLVTPSVLRARGVKFFTVPCCKTCNKTLGAKLLANYEERIGFLYRKTQEKFEKSSYWTEDEIKQSGLKGELKRFVAAKSAHIRREILERLRGMETNIVRIDEINEKLS